MTETKVAPPRDLAGLKKLDPEFFAQLKADGAKALPKVYSFYEQYGPNNGPSGILVTRIGDYHSQKNVVLYRGFMTDPEGQHLIALPATTGRKDATTWYPWKDTVVKLVRAAVGDVSYGFKYLQELPKGTVLHTVIRKVAPSGMSRVMDVIHLGWDPERQEVQKCYVRVKESSSFIQDLDASRKAGGDYRIGGCGMDMGFALVSELGEIVHGDGYWFEQKWI